VWEKRLPAGERVSLPPETSPGRARLSFEKRELAGIVLSIPSTGDSNELAPNVHHELADAPVLGTQNGSVTRKAGSHLPILTRSHEECSSEMRIVPRNPGQAQLRQRRKRNFCFLSPVSDMPKAGEDAAAKELKFKRDQHT